MGSYISTYIPSFHESIHHTHEMSVLYRASKASLQSATIMFAGDMLAQTLMQVNDAENKKKSKTFSSNLIPKYDLDRSKNWFIVGLVCHGPTFFFGFGGIDKFYGPQKTMNVVLKKILTAQLGLFGPYLFGFLSLMTYLEGGNVMQEWEKGNLKQKWISSFSYGLIFWPTANIINFKYLSPNTRVAYAACAGILWNTFLSWLLANLEATQ